MKRLSRKLLSFIITALLIALLADLCISQGLTKTERGHFYTMNKLMNDTINADVIVLGNSRASGSYHPEVLDSILGTNTWNLGVSGQPFGVSYLRWRLYRRNNNPPKLLVVNMDYAELEMVNNGFEREQYYPYMNDALVKPYLDLYGFSWADKYIPMYRYRGDYKLMGIGLTEWFGFHHDTKGNYIKGYSNENWAWDGEKLEEVLQQGVVKDHCNPQAVELLELLLKEARDDQIKVVFVYAPLFRRLKEHLDEADSQQAYQALAEKYGVPIVDFSTMEFCEDTCCFHNANHVNSKGAVRFSVALACSLDSLQLFRRINMVF